MNQKLSVVIIIYKAEMYLRQCLDSVLAQTYKNLEIILVVGIKNGVSQDSSLDIAREYEKRDERIKLTVCEAKGPADARNKGLALVTGDLLGFVDSDDFIEPDMFETMIRNAEETSSQISVCGRFYEFENITKSDSGSRVVLNSSEALKMMITDTGFFFHCWDKIYTKEVFEGLYFPEDCTVEDRIVVNKLMDKATNIVYDPTPKYHFRERYGSTSKEAGVSTKYNEEANTILVSFLKEKHPELNNETGKFNLYEMITCLQNVLIAKDCTKKDIDYYRDKVRVIMKEEANNPLISRKIRIKAILAVYFTFVLKMTTKRSINNVKEELIRFP